MKLCLRCNQYFEDTLELCPKDKAPLESVGKDPLIGALISDRYVVESVIGKGSTGIVYKARRMQRGEMVVAVKVLHSYLGADTGTLDQFLREAKAASRLRNPHIINIWDWGVTEDGQPFFVMDYLEGPTLARLLQDKKILPASRALPIIRQICEALSEAHRQGIVHRDLKPENAILQETDYGDDYVKLLDFGIAESPRDLWQKGRDGNPMISGSPAYMSPEQCQGLALDARSDIYSLAVMVFEIFAGKRPFQAEGNFSLMSMHVDAPPMKLADARPDIKFPSSLQEVFNRALAKKPDARQANVKEFWCELEEAIQETEFAKSTLQIADTEGSQLGVFSQPTSDWVTQSDELIDTIKNSDWSLAQVSAETKALPHKTDNGQNRLHAPLTEATERVETAARSDNQTDFSPGGKNSVAGEAALNQAVVMNSLQERSKNAGKLDKKGSADSNFPRTWSNTEATPTPMPTRKGDSSRSANDSADNAVRDEVTISPTEVLRLNEGEESARANVQALGETPPPVRFKTTGQVGRKALTRTWQDALAPVQPNQTIKFVHNLPPTSSPSSAKTGDEKGDLEKAMDTRGSGPPKSMDLPGENDGLKSGLARGQQLDGEARRLPLSPPLLPSSQAGPRTSEKPILKNLQAGPLATHVKTAENPAQANRAVRLGPGALAAPPPLGQSPSAKNLPGLKPKQPSVLGEVTALSSNRLTTKSSSMALHPATPPAARKPDAIASSKNHDRSAEPQVVPSELTRHPTEVVSAYIDPDDSSTPDPAQSSIDKLGSVVEKEATALGSFAEGNIPTGLEGASVPAEGIRAEAEESIKGKTASQDILTVKAAAGSKPGRYPAEATSSLPKHLTDGISSAPIGKIRSRIEEFQVNEPEESSQLIPEVARTDTMPASPKEEPKESLTERLKDNSTESLNEDKGEAPKEGLAEAQTENPPAIPSDQEAKSHQAPLRNSEFNGPAKGIGNLFSDSIVNRDSVNSMLLSNISVKNESSKETSEKSEFVSENGSAKPCSNISRSSIGISRLLEAAKKAGNKTSQQDVQALAGPEAESESLLPKGIDADPLNSKRSDVGQNQSKFEESALAKAADPRLAAQAQISFPDHHRLPAEEVEVGLPPPPQSVQERLAVRSLGSISKVDEQANQVAQLIEAKRLANQQRLQEADELGERQEEEEDFHTFVKQKYRSFLDRLSGSQKSEAEAKLPQVSRTRLATLRNRKEGINLSMKLIMAAAVLVFLLFASTLFSKLTERRSSSTVVHSHDKRDANEIRRTLELKQETGELSSSDVDELSLAYLTLAQKEIKARHYSSASTFLQKVSPMATCYPEAIKTKNKMRRLVSRK